MNGDSPCRLGYQRGLDGLRGLSIILVVLCHGEILGRGFGFIGVNTFFVLSGFLISTLLVAEWNKSRTISFRDFYIRRALRLLPALLTMLAVFTIYALAAVQLPFGDNAGASAIASYLKSHALATAALTGTYKR